jgi:hypothetical protein
MNYATEGDITMAKGVAKGGRGKKDRRKKKNK